LRGLAAVRLDEVSARTSTAAYRIWLSVNGSEIVRLAYPPAKQIALALYEGWPGRALRHWAVTTRKDRGLTERSWPDPVMAEGWPFYALDQLVASERLPKAVRWELALIKLRAITDAQIDLWAQRPLPAEDDELYDWLTEIGRQSPVEAKEKIEVARNHPGRLAAAFLGWWTLERLADRSLPTPNATLMRRLAACTEWPPDLLPICLDPNE
ncbi:MAG: hypothetical protein AAF449_15675, partial [Myxococcota bacterium]